jgi:hypothetical protein
VTGVGGRLPVGSERVVAVYDVHGDPLVDFEHPLGVVVAAAFSFVLGDRETALQRLDHAERLDARHPTYYGSAWVALGRLLLTAMSLGPCPPGGSSSPLRRRSA